MTKTKQLAEDKSKVEINTTLGQSLEKPVKSVIEIVSYHLYHKLKSSLNQVASILLFLDSTPTKMHKLPEIDQGKNKASGMTFGEAIEHLKKGEKIARSGWNGKGMFVYYVPAATYPAQRNKKGTMQGVFPDDMVPYNHYMALKGADNTVSTWAPSVTDALAEDWEIVK